MNSRECLKLLNLSPDANDQDIKLAYRKAVKQWHPDRHQQASSLVKEKAEKQMQALNTAYTILNDYYDKHGHLPGYISPQTVTPSYSDTHNAQTHESSVSDVDFSSDTAHRQPHTAESNFQQPVTKNKSSRLIWFSVILFGIILYYSFDRTLTDTENLTSDVTNQINTTKQTSSTTSPELQDKVGEEKDEEELAKANSPFAVKERTSAFAPTSNLGIYEEPKDSKYFTYGDTGGRVFEIQGVPTKTVGDIWYYGQSEVHFQDGRVKSWVKFDNQLKAKK